MQVPAFFFQHYDNYFFILANNWEAKAIEYNDKGKFIKSWVTSATARLPYLIDVIINLVAVPLSLIGIVFSHISAAFTLRIESKIFLFSRKKIIEKIHHLFISLFGATVSPWLAHHFANN